MLRLPILLLKESRIAELLPSASTFLNTFVGCCFVYSSYPISKLYIVERNFIFDVSSINHISFVILKLVIFHSFHLSYYPLVLKSIFLCILILSLSFPFDLYLLKTINPFLSIYPLLFILNSPISCILRLYFCILRLYFCILRQIYCIPQQICCIHRLNRCIVR